MENKNTIFITGANRGIGLALVKEALKKIRYQRTVAYISIFWTFGFSWISSLC